jgi:xylulokinase
MVVGETPLFIGIDLGTLDVRGVLVTASGRILAEEHRALAVHRPASGRSEHDPELDWWQTTCSLIQQLLKTSGVSPASVGGVGIAGLFPAACFLDEKGMPIGNALLYSDNLAEHLINEIAETINQPLKGDETLPRLVWFARQRPAMFERIQMVLTSTGYIVYRLTGHFTMDPHNACRFGGGVNQERTGWQADMLDTLGIPAEILPPVLSSTEVAGGVTEKAAQETGLAPSTPVIAGTTDTLAALVGSGVQDLGEAMIYYGSTCTLSVITVPLARAMAQPASFGPDSPYQLAVYLSSSGATLRWAVDLFTALQDRTLEPRSIYEKLDEAASRIAPGSNNLFVLPYFAGRFYPHPDSQARGHIAGLSLQHGIGHIWRALLEAPGYALADRLDYPLPHPLRRLYASGGGAQSAIWRGVISNMLGLPQHYAPEGSGALGAAFLAALGTDHVSSFRAIRDEWLQGVEITEPEADQVARYREKLSVWRRLDAIAGESRVYKVD